MSKPTILTSVLEKALVLQSKEASGMITNASPPMYDFSSPIDVEKAADKDHFFGELVNTSAFRRLKAIRFLGGIDYLLVQSPNGVKIRYTRYQHSLGVARLAMVYSDQRALNFDERRMVYTAALLHDIGHAPLSHSLEPIFLEAFDLDHHRATELILKGEVPIGRELFQLLSRYKIDVEKIIAIITRRIPGYDGFFSGPINFDTIEGILRTQKFAARTFQIPNPESVLNAAIRRESQFDGDLLDEFWTYKDWIYRTVINSRLGVLADSTCRLFMKNNIRKFSSVDYYTDERHIFKLLPGLRLLLTSKLFETDVTQYFPEPILYKSRRFFVSPRGNFFRREDQIRYQQSKEDKLLDHHKLNARVDTVDTPKYFERDLFDENLDAGN